MNEPYLPREQKRHVTELHVAGTLITAQPKDPKVLVIQRSPLRQVSPGKWAGCGGQFDPARRETWVQAMERKWSEEHGIDPMVWGTIAQPYMIYEPEHSLWIPGVRFLCTVPRLVFPDLIPGIHENAQWLSYDDFTSMNPLGPDEYATDFLTDSIGLIERWRVAVGKG